MNELYSAFVVSPSGPETLFTTLAGIVTISGHLLYLKNHTKAQKQLGDGRRQMTVQ